MSGYCFCEHGYGQHGDASNPLRIDALGKPYTVEDANVCWVCDCEQFAKDPEGQAKKDAIKKAERFEKDGCKYPTKSGNPCRKVAERWNQAHIRIGEGYRMGRANYTQADGSPIRCGTHSLHERVQRAKMDLRDEYQDKARDDGTQFNWHEWQRTVWRKVDQNQYADPEATHEVRWPKSKRGSFL